MNDQQNQNEAACGGSALTAELEGKPEPLQFVIAQANLTLRTLVDYEGQYKSSSPKEIQSRILAMADFIKARLDEYAR